MPSKYDYFCLLLIIIMIGISAYFYSFLPERIASHWNIQGRADGFSSKAWFFAPYLGLTVLLYALFFIIPKIDPLKQNVLKFMKYFEWFKVLLILFMLYLLLAVIAANLGAWPNMSYIVLPAVAILLYYAGVLCQHSERNWFIGIRTPWTLSSDTVWKKTHKIGAILFKLLALYTLLAFIVFQFYAIQYFFWAFLIPLLIVAFYPVVYSYFEWKKEEKARKS